MDSPIVLRRLSNPRKHSTLGRVEYELMGGGAPPPSTNTLYLSQITKKAVIKMAKGSYQKDLLEGSQRWSGADLRGKACGYAGGYLISRLNLVERLRRAGYSVRGILVNRRIIAVIRGPGDPAPEGLFYPEV